jgi:hypothetical protein
VLVDEGLATATYTLDEALIDFQSALEELVRGGEWWGGRAGLGVDGCRYGL